MTVYVKKNQKFPDPAVDRQVDDLVRAINTQLDSLNSHIALTAAHGATGAVVGTTNTQTLTNKTLSSPDSAVTLVVGNTGAAIGGSTNRTVIEPDGTLVFQGDATTWEDLNFDPTRSGGPTATRPDDVVINNIFHKEFTSANNQLCGSNQEVAHEAMLSKTLYPHCHVFLKAGESAGTTGVTFTLYWELRQSTGTTTGSVAVSATSAQLSANPHKVNLYDSTGFAGPAELGANLGLTIARTAGNAGDVVVTTYGIHYEIDSTGSRQRDVK